MQSTAVLPPHPVWHPGEQALQTHAGVSARMDAVGRSVVRDHLLPQHRDFFASLPAVMLGAVDAAGDVWATVRCGAPGFAHATDARCLKIEAAAEPDDPAEAGLQNGLAVGLVGIDLSTRRRNRLNGRIYDRDSCGFGIGVAQSFGNCPQYIHARDLQPVVLTIASSPAVMLDHLDAAACRTVTIADTFFVATYVRIDGSDSQVDVSHRGGRPGFVRVGDDGVLTIPDFAGNLFFNTLGNIHANPRAGLLFIDFDTGDLLQMSGSAEVILDSPEIAAFQGAERLWRFVPRLVVHRRNALPMRWTARAGGASPQSLSTGRWPQAEAPSQVAAPGRQWRAFRITAIAQESTEVRSFHLEPADGGGKSPHRAGQHLPIRVVVVGDTAPSIRFYTLSNAPWERSMRISVKLEGKVSGHLHRHLKVGDLLEARAPAGDFTIDAGEPRTAVFLVAGIGVTPAVSMLGQLVFEGKRTGRFRPAWLFHSARSRAVRPFDDELGRLQAAAKGAVRRVRVVGTPIPGEPLADDEVAGRIDMALLKAHLPFGDHDFYVCGPPGFMRSMVDGLAALGIADQRIHTEAFGPASIRPSPSTPLPALPPVATGTVRVSFAFAGKTAEWRPGDGSLLNLAEAAGLSPEFSCRAGSCGSCRTELRSGEVTYTARPGASHGSGEALICCAYPAESSGGGITLAL